MPAAAQGSEAGGERMNANKRKEDIIEAAYKLFQQDGFDNVSVSDICRACKITKPTFYKYIESKEELLLYFYEGLTEMLFDELLDRQGDEDYFEQAFKGIVYNVEKSVEFGHDLYCRYLQYIYHTHNPTNRFRNAATPMTLEAFRKAQETGQIKNMADPELLYISCRCMCLGLSSQWCFGPGDFDLVASLRKSYEQLVKPDWDVIRK